jgi:predicted GNAT family N-acyltransferase
MEIKIEIGQDKEFISNSQKLRDEVFFKEQNIPTELDLDGWDEKSYHSIATVDSIIVGVARLAVHNSQKAVLSRVAVLPDYRGNGIASKLVNSLLDKAYDLNIKNIDIYPHDYLRKFYESLGFKYVESADKVASHQLIKMTKTTFIE